MHKNKRKISAPKIIFNNFFGWQNLEFDKTIC